MEGLVAETAAIYEAVEPALNGGVVMRMMTLKDGWWVRISLPNSTMDIRCPMPGDGYSTMVSIAFSQETESKLGKC